MLSKIKINELIKNTEHFYNIHAEEFSKSRQNPWQGWERCLLLIEKNLKQDDISILDIACGNGRFYKYLLDNSNYELDYLGLDNNDYMLVEAVLKYQLANFSSFDVFFDLKNLNDNYNVVSVFGFTHHIPDHNFRRQWFKQLSSLVKPHGLLLLTFWNLPSDERFKKAVKAEDLEENDYYYGWGDSEDKRYVHLYSDDELNDIINTLEQRSFKVIDEFYADGKNNNMNRYIIFELLSDP